MTELTAGGDRLHANSLSFILFSFFLNLVRLLAPGSSLEVLLCISPFSLLFFPPLCCLLSPIFHVLSGMLSLARVSDFSLSPGLPRSDQ